MDKHRLAAGCFDFCDYPLSLSVVEFGDNHRRPLACQALGVGLSYPLPGSGDYRDLVLKTHILLSLVYWATFLTYPLVVVQITQWPRFCHQQPR